jgi:5-amino-6-(5-phosphoribosylamino)uracil reductase
MTFEELVQRKEEAAGRSLLPPYTTDIERRTSNLEVIGNDWSRSIFDGDFLQSERREPSRPACNLVFVQSKDGNTGASDPSTLGGGATDLHLIYEGLSRVSADGVLAGAETLRGGEIALSVWHPQLVALRARLKKPRHPVQIVATLRGVDLTRGLLFNTPALPVVILTIGQTVILMQAALADRPWIKTVVMPRPSDLAQAFEQLRALGLERISCIGGRQLATQLIDAGLVQDVYLTTAPQAGGQPNTPFYPGQLNNTLVLRKHGTGPETGVTFEHLVI